MRGNSDGEEQRQPSRVECGPSTSPISSLPLSRRPTSRTGAGTARRRARHSLPESPFEGSLLATIASGLGRLNPPSLVSIKEAVPPIILHSFLRLLLTSQCPSMNGQVDTLWTNASLAVPEPTRAASPSRTLPSAPQSARAVFVSLSIFLLGLQASSLGQLAAR